MQIISSFFDNLKQKTTNPFFGTLIFVWLIRNWELVYTLFNFDKDCNLADKKSFIINYYSSRSIWTELLYNVGISLILMIFAYLLIVLTRVFVNWVEHKIIPELNLKFVSKLVVNSSRYDESEKQRIENYNALVAERENINKLELKNSELKNNLGNLSLELTKSEIGVKNLDFEKSELIIRNTNLESSKDTLEANLKISDNELSKAKRKLDWIDQLSMAKERLYIGDKISPFIFDLYVKLEEMDSALVAFYLFAENIQKKEELESEFNPLFTSFFIDNYMFYNKLFIDDLEYKKTKNFILTEYGEELVKYRKILNEEYRDAKNRALPKATIEKL